MGKYLYCIIKSFQGEEFEASGVEGGKIYTLSQGNLMGVVSDTETKEFFPTRENLIAHQKVVEEILKRHTLLPISFGTVAQGSDEVKKLLKENRQEISRTLKKIDGKIELGLKVFWQNMPEIFQEIVKENKEIQDAKAKKNVGRNTMLAVGEMVAKALEKKKIKEAVLILQPLSKIAEDFKKGEPLRDDMILNVNFLVDRSKEKNFDQAVNQLDEKYGQRVKFKYIGPISPTSFIQLHLKI